MGAFATELEEADEGFEDAAEAFGFGLSSTFAFPLD